MKALIYFITLDCNRIYLKRIFCENRGNHVNDSYQWPWPGGFEDNNGNDLDVFTGRLVNSQHPQTMAARCAAEPHQCVCFLQQRWNQQLGLSLKSNQDNTRQKGCYKLQPAIWIGMPFFWEV